MRPRSVEGCASPNWTRPVVQTLPLLSLLSAPPSTPLLWFPTPLQQTATGLPQPLRHAPHAVRAMSLNGLDTPTVVEAYQNALADAGGW